MAAPASAGLSKGGIAFFSSLCVSTFGLGCWQSQRYFEKIELMAQRDTELLMDPLPLEKDAKCSRADGTKTGNETNVMNTNTNTNTNEIKRGFRPVHVEGTFQHDQELLVGPRGPPPGAISSSGPNSGRSSGGMSSSPQVRSFVRACVFVHDFMMVTP